MNYYNTSKQFEKYGRNAMLINSSGKSIPFRAFLQPLRYKNKIYLRGKFTEIGKNREDYYLYIGPPDVDIADVNGITVKLLFDSESYLVYRTERHYIGNNCVYVWAIIRPVVDDSENEDIDIGGDIPIG